MEEVDETNEADIRTVKNLDVRRIGKRSEREAYEADWQRLARLYSVSCERDVVYWIVYCRT